MPSASPTFRASAIANYAGLGWTALMGIAFLPLYLVALGVESYAMVGIFAILQAWMGLLDLGITPTLNREMARLRAGSHTPQSIRNLLRSLETICSGIMGIAAVLVWLVAPWLVAEWLNPKGLSPEVAIQAIRIMGFVVSARLLEQLYRGALQGADDQVWLSAAGAVLATLRWGGAYLVVTLAAPSVIRFFYWQGLVSVLTTCVLVWRTYRILPASIAPGRFQPSALVDVYTFARGMFVGSILAFILTQIDKVMVSRLVPLADFGYYTLAATLGGGLMQLAAPLNATVFPRLTIHASNHDTEALRRTYEESCEWMSAVIFGPAMLLVLFPELVLFAWTGNHTLTLHVAPLLSLLACGYLFNALMNIPYMLQLASGWTGLAIRVNLVAVALVIPAMLWAVPLYGAVAAALVWLALNFGYLSVGAHFMYRRLLPATKWRWYRVSVLRPGVAAGLTGLIASMFPLSTTSRLEAGGTAIALLLAMSLATIASLPHVRMRIFQRSRANA